MVTRVIIASHRGFCAGVERAVETVERALDIYGPPVYARKQIVHNTHVVRDLEAGRDLEQARDLQVPDPERVAYVTQTTLSLDETAEILAVLRRRFPAIV